MPFELFVALRYLTAKRKQTLVSVVTLIATAGVAVGVMALVIALALMTGFSSDIQSKILGAEAHVFVYGGRLQGGIDDWRAVSRELESIEGVVATAPNVLDQGILEGPLERDRVSLRGVLPGLERGVTDLDTKMMQGALAALETPDADGRPGIVLGKDLAQELGVLAGDKVSYLSLSQPTLSPVGALPRRRAFVVVGIFETGLYEYDRSWALVHLPVAQQMLRIGEAATVVKARTRSLGDIESVTAATRALVGQRLVVRDLIALNRPLFSAFKLEKLLMFITIGLIVVVAALNIVTTLTMMVMEKNKDIGILVAMGVTPPVVTRVFVLQGVVIGIVGTVLGTVAGMALCWTLDTYRLISLPTSVYYIPYLPFRMVASDIVKVDLVAVLVSFVATIYPARRAARLDPVEALRYE